MPRDWRLRVEDILEAIARIERFTADLDEAKFKKDEQAFYAVVSNLHIIGEAAARMPAPIREKYPDISWQRMRGLRNILVHEYFAVDATVIWQAATEDAPALKEPMRMILNREPEEMP